jgi:hypothetical protein
VRQAPPNDVTGRGILAALALVTPLWVLAAVALL